MTGIQTCALPISATVAAHAVEVIDRWDLDATMAAPHHATMEDYDDWTAGYEPSELEDMSCGDKGCFSLIDVREDGYREYGYGRDLGNERT